MCSIHTDSTCLALDPVVVRSNSSHADAKVGAFALSVGNLKKHNTNWICSCLTIQTARSISLLDVYRCRFLQACSAGELHHSKRELNPQVLHPWKSLSKGVARVKRDWIIPPIRVLENSKQVPEDLVQVTWTKTHIFCSAMITSSH